MCRFHIPQYSLPNDSCLLPKIDQLVDETIGHSIFSFIDTYWGYNQIKMYEPNKKITNLMKNHRIFCYKIMHFGLKNVGAINWKLKYKMFIQLIRHTIEVYMDHMITSSKSLHNHVKHLGLNFNILRKYRMKLNPTNMSSM